MSAQIGQYRFRGAGTCVTEVESSKSYKSVSMTGSAGTDDTSFQDIRINTSSPLVRDTDYYLYVKIPQDMNYNLTFNIKLTKQEQQGGTEEYQFLKQITIPRGGSATNTYNVVLYNTSENKVRAMIPHTYRSGTQNVKDDIYWDAVSNAYYLGNGNTTYTRTQEYNDIVMTASWIHQAGSYFGYAEMVFRPVEDNFSEITIEMVRTAEDYNIQGVDQNDETIYGRYIPLDSFEYTLYSLTNLVNDINPNGTLDRIGVWSHPGLLMAVNGEEIRVGKSGLWEIDGILPIKSLGIVAVDYKDNFSIDYFYET